MHLCRLTLSSFIDTVAHVHAYIHTYTRIVHMHIVLRTYMNLRNCCSQNQMPFFKFRLIRLMTSGWNLSPEMIAEQLRAHFANVDSVLQGMAVDMLLKKLV